MRLFYALSKINLWPNFWRSQIATAPISGAIKSYVVSSTLSKLSIGEVVRNVKLLGKIISAFSPQNEFLHKRRMDPAGFEPASATGQSAVFQIGKLWPTFFAFGWRSASALR
jgi:hypothetical protein